VKTIERNATPRQTYALYCATGIDWRTKKLSFDQASEMVKAVMGSKNKKTALEKCESIIQTETAPKKRGRPRKDDQIIPAHVATPDTQNRVIYDEAEKAGKEAANACNQPITVGELIHLLEKVDESATVENPDSMKGTASVHVLDGRLLFSKWLLKKRLAKKAHTGHGVEIYISEYDNILRINEAHANAFQEVLAKYDIKSQVITWMD
jgi:hypothetical protein